MFLFIDTETTDTFNFKVQASDPCQPDMIEMSAALFDADRRLVQCLSTLVRCPNIDGWKIEPNAEALHGISNDLCQQYGTHPNRCLAILNRMAERANLVVAHNVKFDLAVLNTASVRNNVPLARSLVTGPFYCTMERATDICCFPFPDGTGNKWPKLEEAYEFFTGRERIEPAHCGLYDVLACADVFFALRREPTEAVYLDELLNVLCETK